PEGIEPFRPQLPAHAGLLAATERTGIVVEQRSVDPHHARLQLVHGPHRLIEVARVDRGTQAVARAVGMRDGLLEACDPAHRSHRPEGLVIQDSGPGRNVDQHGRLDEPTALQAGRAPAAGGMTMDGSVPEVSMSERLYMPAQVCATHLPVAIPPVKATVCVSG